MVAYVGFNFGLVPSLTTVTSFGLFVLLGNALTPAVAFTSIMLFNILQGPISMVPMVLQFYTELQNSSSRLEAFLLAEERDAGTDDTSSVWRWDPDDNTHPTALQISNGAFRWREGKAPKEEANPGLSHHPGHR